MSLLVNGERIEDSEIEREVERLRPRYEQVFAEKDEPERETQLRQWSRDNVIERVLLRQETGKDSDPIPPEQIETAFAHARARFESPAALYAALEVENDDQARAEIAKQMHVERKIAQVYAGIATPSEQEVRDFYEQNRDRFRSPEQVHAAHIVKYVNWQTSEADAREALTQARQEIQNGALFEMLVGKVSDCPDRGGDLGLVARGQMVEEFEDVVFKLGVGQVSDVFRTRFGYHLAKVYRRLPSQALDLKEVEATIVKELKEQEQEQALADYLDDLADKAVIEEA